MAKNVKRKVVFSVLTLCLLLVLLAGSTYALFTDSADTSIVVSSAKVDIEAEILDDYKLYSLEVLQTNGKFELGGTANFVQENGQLTGDLELINIAPGDRIEFTIQVTNHSNIDILQRVRIVGSAENADNEVLLDGLVVKVDGQVLDFDNAPTSSWELLSPSTTPTNITISIELPVTAGNEYQNLKCTISLMIDAYQGNANKAPGWTE